MSQQDPDLASDDMQRNMALFKQSDEAWQNGDLTAAFNLQEKITGLIGNDLAALLIRAGYLLLEAGSLVEAASWFDLAEEEIDPTTFTWMPVCYSDLFVMASLGRIEAYSKANQIDRVKHEISKLVNWLRLSVRDLLDGPLEPNRERIETIYRVIDRDKNPLAITSYPLWATLRFGENDDSFYSFKHDVANISYLFENRDALISDPALKAWVILFYAEYVCLNTKDNGFEEYDRLVRIACKMTDDPNMQIVAKDHAQLTISGIVDHTWDVSLEDVLSALELDPTNPVLLETREKLAQGSDTSVASTPAPKTPGMSVRVFDPNAFPVARSSIFFSSQEVVIYEAMVAAFPDLLVLPNPALQTLIEYAELRKIIKPDDFTYYLQTHVDFCLVSKRDYRPLVAFELDSSYHDSKAGQNKDQVKNMFFYLARIPLIRLRNPGRMTSAEIQAQIKEAVKEAGLRL